MFDAAIDDLLDRTVLAGYTSVGYRLRSRSWPPAALEPLPGGVVMITGAASGLGLAAAAGFARLGATVWLVVRSQARGEEALGALRRRGLGASLRIGVCDLSDLGSVRRFADEFRAASERLDVLVNNAGVLTASREVSADGIELTFAVNVVAPFLLTNLLLPRLIGGAGAGAGAATAREGFCVATTQNPSLAAGVDPSLAPDAALAVGAAAGARIINVSSGGMYLRRLRVEDLQSAQGRFDGAAVYARSKRAEVVLTELFAERLHAAPVAVHAMHPGWADTPGLQASLPGFSRLVRPLLRTPEQGADTIVWLGAAAEPGRSSGRFWHDRRARPTHLLGLARETEREREALWSACVELAGLSDRPTDRPWEMSDGALPSHS